MFNNHSFTHLPFLEYQSQETYLEKLVGVNIRDSPTTTTSSKLKHQVRTSNNNCLKNMNSLLIPIYRHIANYRKPHAGLLIHILLSIYFIAPLLLTCRVTRLTRRWNILSLFPRIPSFQFT